jgi:hypothetical protein
MVLIETKQQQLSAIVNTYQALGGGVAPNIPRRLPPVFDGQEVVPDGMEVVPVPVPDAAEPVAPLPLPAPNAPE